MTGEEWLYKVRSFEEITDIQWDFKGDYFEPEEVKVVIVADGETYNLIYPRSSDSNDVQFMQFAAMALVIHRFMELMGDDFNVCYSDDIAKAVNYSLGRIKEIKEKNSIAKG